MKNFKLNNKYKIKLAKFLQKFSPSRIFYLSIIMISISGCSGTEEEFNLTRNIRDAYVDAQEAVETGNFRKAVGIFEALQARFPFSQFATQIQLELSYAYYKDGRNEQAIEAAETFIRENPTHSRVDYAMYIKGLAYFEKGQSYLERFFRKDINLRPPQDGELAFLTLSRMVERYPASPYANDAQQRMVYLKNRLASYENAVAQFYLERKAYVAAINRAKTAIEIYQGADSASDSLQIIIQAYEALGMHELAKNNQRVLEKTFPESL